MAIDVRTLIAFLFCVNLALLTISGPFVTKLSAVHILIAGGFLLQLAISVVVYLKHRPSLLTVDIAVLVFAAYMITMPMYSLLVGHSLNDVIRGTIPFLFLPAAYFSVVLLDWRRTRWVLTALFCVGVFVATLVIPFLILRSAGELESINRLTAYSDMAHLPALIISLALLKLVVRNVFFRFFLFGLLILALYETQSKGQLGIGLFVLLAVPWALGWRISMENGDMWEWAGYVLLSFLLLSILIFYGPSLDNNKSIDNVGLVKNRYSVESLKGSTTLHRWVEIKKAYNIFSENMVIGAGPGVTFKFLSPVSGGVVEQRYIHNLIFYLLATGGVVGFVLYCAQFFFSLTLEISFQWKEAARYLYLAIAGALMYGMVSATYKSIHMNVFVGVLLGGISVLHRAANCGVNSNDE